MVHPEGWFQHSRLLGRIGHHPVRAVIVVEDDCYCFYYYYYFCSWSLISDYIRDEARGSSMGIIPPPSVSKYIRVIYAI